MFLLQWLGCVAHPGVAELGDQVFAGGRNRLHDSYVLQVGLQVGPGPPCLMHGLAFSYKEVVLARGILLEGAVPLGQHFAEQSVSVLEELGARFHINCCN